MMMMMRISACIYWKKNLAERIDLLHRFAGCLCFADANNVVFLHARALTLTSPCPFP